MSKVAKQETTQPEGSAESPDVVRFPTTETVRSVLDDLVRRGAQRMLQSAIEAEVDAFLHEQQNRRNADGQRLVVHNGYLPTREIITGAGALEIAQPRVRDKSPDAAARVRFSPQIVPAYLRRSKSVEEFIPWLYFDRRLTRSAGRIAGKRNRRSQSRRNRATKGSAVGG